MAMASFTSVLADHGLAPLSRPTPTTLQINVGKRCNQACRHCHVDAGPTRTEMMTGETVDRLLRLLATSVEVTTVDITGGAPELNPHFRRLVSSARGLGKHVMDRCNLTVLHLEGQEDTAEFLAHNQVEIVASLPCYGPENVDTQRGRGVFEQSIRALQQLNELGYGQAGTGLLLNLVYNPLGAFLPPAQPALEAAYKTRLAADHGVVFNQLYTITNMPIHRFRSDLERSGEFDAYMELLLARFNPASVAKLMCHDLVSVSWDGQLHDCDFNQMLSMGAGARAQSIWEIDTLAELTGALIATGTHCLGCTAGAGSSCGGALSAG